MAIVNPPTRANYEPNSWSAEEGGPREDPAHGFKTYPEADTGPKRRLRPESFADHYSQARQFYVSQTPVEQRHIVDAFVFELSKCDREAIRTRMLAGLRNVHDDLARSVADGLGLTRLPTATKPAREPIADLPPSPALSIIANGPADFSGRKIGILLSDGANHQTLAALQTAAKARDVTVELIAPNVGGVKLSNGTRVPADQKIEGGPSVLYDAVAILVSEQGASNLAAMPAARDFASDAYAHCKFIAYDTCAQPLLSAAGITPDQIDDGFIALTDRHSTTAFLDQCAHLRFWERETPGA